GLRPGATVALMAAAVRLCSATRDRVRFALVVIAFIIDHAQDIVRVADLKPNSPYTWFYLPSSGNGKTSSRAGRCLSQWRRILGNHPNKESAPSAGASP